MADIVWLKGFQFFDSNGDPLNGGRLRIYDAGTTTERTVYQDSAAATPWSQPIILTSAGRLTASIFVPEGAWKFALTTSADTTFASPIVTEDNIPGATASSSVAFARPQTPIITKAANYSVTADDLGSLFVLDATGGSFTLSLPHAAGVASGKGFDVLVVGTSGSVTLDGDGSETINGSTTLVLRAQYGSVQVVSDGANWQALATRIPATTPAAKTTGFTVALADEGRMFLCDATSAGFTATLPSASTAGNGFRVGFKKTDASTNAVTMDGNASETIDGATTLAMAARYDTIWLICDGTSWHVQSFHNTQVRAIGQVVTAADQLLYATGAGTFAGATLTSAARSLLDDPSASDQRTTLDVARLGVRDIISNSSSRDLALTDRGCTLEMANASGRIYTIPTQASVAWIDDTWIEVVRMGTGALTITAAGGVTLNGIVAGSCTIDAQYKSAILRRRTEDNWGIVGSHSVVA